MATIQRFENLEVWQLGRELAFENFAETLSLAFSKDFKLVGQIRRSSGSGMDNLAEGFERGGEEKFIQFLGITKGSAGEVRSQPYLAFERNHLAKERFDFLFEQAIALNKKLSTLITYLKNSEFKGFKFKDVP